MFEPVMKIFGQYSVYFVVFLKEFLTYFVYAVVLSIRNRKRQLWQLRLIFGFVTGIILCIPLGILRTEISGVTMKIICSSIIVIYIFALLFFAYKENFAEICFCWTGVIATKGFSGNLFALMLNLCGKNDLETISFFDKPNDARDWAINFAIHFIILAAVWFVIRKNDKLTDDASNVRSAIILIIITFLLNCPLYALVHDYQAADFNLAICCKLLFTIIYFFILAVRAGFLRNDRISAELKITDELLRQDKKRYAEMKDNVDLINMKCHDVKRQLTAFQGKLTDAEINALSDAIKIYDSNLKTGNEILDTVLYQKRLYCENNGINLSCIADGKRLDFISSADLYALSSNALENAIEAVNKLDDDEKKVITFSVRKDRNAVLIETTNYYCGVKELSNGQMQTDKPDKIHHGYGIKSMRYIAKSYGGELSFYTEDDMFFLNITVPIPKKAE